MPVSVLYKFAFKTILTESQFVLKQALPMFTLNMLDLVLDDA
jgi:hypothetical protein